MASSTILSTLALCLIALVGVTVGASPQSVQHSLSAVSPPSPCRVAVFSLPSRGHVNPLIGLAEELQTRGCDITFPIPRDAAKWLDGTTIEPEPVDMSTEGMSVEVRADFMKRGSNKNIFMALQMTAGRFINASTPLSDHLRKQWTRNASLVPDVMVVDFAGVTGILLAHEFGIPLVVNNPGMMLFNSKVVDALYAPAPFAQIPVEMGLVERMKNILFAIGYNAFDIFMGYGLDELMLASDPTAQRRWSLGSFVDTAEAILCNTVIGLDYARPVDPRIILTGPMNRISSNELSEDLSQWIDAQNEVIYVSFGTMVVLTREQVFNISAALDRLGVATVWSLAKDQRQFLGVSQDDMPANVRLETYVAQPQLLRHPKLRLFHTHGGANSAHDVLAAGKPVVCTPVFGDQPEVCQRMVSHGFGVRVLLEDLQSDKVYNAIHQVLRDSSFEARTQQLSKVIGRSKGAVLGADTVLMAALGELDHLKRPQRPFYQNYNLDYLAAFAVAVVVWWCLAQCCLRCCWRCCSSRSAQKLKSE